ncbi:hypothetical protein SPMU_19940 [Sphingomonas mucosissima]|uniref:Uncharacterized protein n=1 Tax=Sphingomonas mucosissima TaxID=370959 RepID=A0A245ZIL5_9SPHN|nr:hypothetical protein SPMU_19940 [Sphingomonas mucosissima]
MAAVAIVEAVGGAVVVAELEFGKVAVQMLLVAVLIHTLHAALEGDPIGADPPLARFMRFRRMSA